MAQHLSPIRTPRKPAPPVAYHNFQNSPKRDPSRDSTVESAGQAADIFDLYGAVGEDEEVGDMMERLDVRQSWTSGRNGVKGESVEGEEEGSSWEGPMRALASTPERQGRWSMASENTPDISITSPPSPSPPSAPSTRPPSQPHTPSPRRRNESQYSAITVSTTDSPGRSSQRLSPADTTGKPRSSMSTGFSTTTDGAQSQTSVAGSSRYPGEEEDSFHVRSTYARLDAEGVHGDGWDQGVERTRGGPATLNKRATMLFATKSGDLGEKEKQYLSSLDRYGFVKEPHRNRSESRLASIPSAALSKVPKLPSHSPLSGKPPVEPNNNFGPSNGNCPTANPPKSPSLDGSEEDRAKRKETERVGKWARMMKVKKRDPGGNIAEWDWSHDRQGTKLQNRVYKGIPDRWRMAAWWTLSDGQAQQWKGKGKGKASAPELIKDYNDCINLPSTFDVQIDLDVPRTISGHTMFVTRYGTGQRNLWHVLHCFGQLCETCGYVQGMGPLAATLLCYYEPERAYALMVRLHDVYGMHDIFEPGFPGLLEAFYVQERLMEWLMPDVYQSFQRNTISTTSWGTKWFITLFVNTVPFSQQLRIWDVLWMEGRDVVIITSLAILWAFRDLLASPHASFESILSLLSSYFVAEDEDSLMQWIHKVLALKGLRGKMDGWRVEWKGLVKEGKSDTALL
ncbi:hypothetical protein B9479_003214 [Cryptococcus floricola]|uniref:Rab-GAP TBC domain-containing protein n=1 Tax=Cryptococcus floricola TaxID=2591691 RepID=A0A5D3B047_9TREE|nr:hypothetical protein B9479_003214 [Cryptococcus floricola]